MNHRLGIIGGGNMGGAIVRGCIRAGVYQPHEIIVAEIDELKAVLLRETGCVVTSEVRRAADAEQVLLAIKPQVFPNVASEIATSLKGKAVISIMAGLSSSTIMRELGGNVRVVRAMPNVACQISQGMTAVAIGAGAQAGDEKVALRIFDSLGKTVVMDESLMYAATAVSGSGPAYVFLLAEAMERAAIELGIDQEHARTMVAHTIRGAGQMLIAIEASAAELRVSVTSPGGTTAAALKIFEERRFAQAVSDALTAARDRGRQLDEYK